MKLLLNRNGFTSITLALMLIVIPTAVLAGVRFYEAIQKGAQLQKSTTTKGQLNNIKNWLMATSADPDTDGQAELLKENAGSTLPLSIPLKQTDDYGTAFRYYTWDLSTANTNATYSQNNVAPPAAGIVGRILSAGKDGVFQTNNTGTVALGDDIMVNITNTDIQNNTNTSGWREDILNNKVTLMNDGRNIGIGTQNPTSKLHIAGTVNATGNITVGGTGTFTGNVTAPNVVSGDNENKTTLITDPNAHLPSGFYNINGGTNLPYNTWWHMIQTSHVYGGHWAYQTIADLFNASSVYTREIQNDVPTPWIQSGASAGIRSGTLYLGDLAKNFNIAFNPPFPNSALSAVATVSDFSGAPWVPGHGLCFIQVLNRFGMSGYCQEISGGVQQVTMTWIATGQ